MARKPTEIDFTKPKEDAARMGVVAILAMLSFMALVAVGLMWIGSLVPQNVLGWALVVAAAAFGAAFTLGVILAVIGARSRSNLLEGEELDHLGNNWNIKRKPEERDGTYRRRIQRTIVSRETGEP